jgi:uncharacterized protein YidB (DUF937 family)
MGNDFMGQILGSVLGGARARQQSPMGGGMGGLDDLLGGVLGRGGAGAGHGVPMGRGGSPFGGGRGALMAMLLPLAMQWVQRNGGLGAVLQRFRQNGYGPQANSWMSTGPNDPIAPDAVDEVIGHEELSRLSQQLGVSDREVASGFAEIMPEMVNQLTPDGELPPDADRVLDDGRMTLEQYLRQAGIH